MRENRQERSDKDALVELCACLARLGVEGLQVDEGEDADALESVQALLAFGDTEGALAALGALIAERDGPDARRLLASIHRDRGELPEAVAAVDTGVALARRELARALCERARIEVESGKLAEASGSFAEACALAPALVEAHVGLGSLALHASDAGRAEAHFRGAKSAEDGNVDARALAGLGLSLAAQGRALEAIPEFEAALDLDPDAVAALHGMVQAAFQTGETVGAERRVDAYLERHPANVDLWFTAAGLRYRRGDRVAARTALDQIRLFDPDYSGLAELGARLDA